MSLRGTYKDRAIKAILNHLEKIAPTIVANQIASVSYKNQTYNLHDSYGWCIYYGGKPYKMSFAGSAKATEARKWKGREIMGRLEITDLFTNGYKPTAPIELALGVAMPYGKILQERKYEVFALAISNLEASTKEIKGAVFKRVK